MTWSKDIVLPDGSTVTATAPIDPASIQPHVGIPIEWHEPMLPVPPASGSPAVTFLSAPQAMSEERVVVQGVEIHNGGLRRRRRPCIRSTAAG
ncbi:unannotated protein [freshwater metagenome]|uniref:Unannotated protein n=1 Tax=freshwater metagenome TaxID=449393 RepID=A0A6J7DVW8_9ZZZZ|nr:hypothetical protein [Actinomycetota bacterium]